MDEKDQPLSDPQGEQEERFVSDTQKIVRRHLENEDDVISDEDIANVRVGMTPPLDNEDQATIRDYEERLEEKDPNNSEEGLPGKQKMTPWDVIDPGT